MPAATIAATTSDADEPAGVLIDTAEVPGGHLRLLRHGTHYEIMFGDEQLMGSWSYRSEQALATLALSHLKDRRCRVLIGGLGMGFTLAAARETLGPDATIVVAELVPEIVAWADGPLSHLLGRSLRDERVTLQLRDVHDLIDEQAAAYDAILLDVDNGPDGLISQANERLYSNWGLRAAHAALRPGGMLAIWSAYPDDIFAARLRKAGFDVEEVRVDTDGKEDNPDHTIWLAHRMVD